jgi:hypothetical protein
MLNLDTFEFIEEELRKPPKGFFKNPSEASYRHLLETPSHSLLQKVKGYVV